MVLLPKKFRGYSTVKNNNIAMLSSDVILPVVCAGKKEVSPVFATPINFPFFN